MNILFPVSPHFPSFLSSPSCNLFSFVHPIPSPSEFVLSLLSPRAGEKHWHPPTCSCVCIKLEWEKRHESCRGRIACISTGAGFISTPFGVHPPFLFSPPWFYFYPLNIDGRVYIHPFGLHPPLINFHPIPLFHFHPLNITSHLINQVRRWQLI